MTLATRAARYLTTIIIMREPPAWEDLKRYRRTTAPVIYGVTGIMRSFLGDSKFARASSRCADEDVIARREIRCRYPSEIGLVTWERCNVVPLCVRERTREGIWVRVD